VESCTENREVGRLVCTEHIKLSEEDYQERLMRKAIVELRRRAKRAGEPLPSDFVMASPRFDTTSGQRSVKRSLKEKRALGIRSSHSPQKSNSKIVMPTRKYTHNEQLCVRPCGVVTARATFFRAEGRISVKASKNN
jgi:hypothetical protein